MSNDTEARLQRLEDRSELADLLSSYGRLVDDRDFAGLAELFTSDAEFESAQGRSSGKQAVIDYYRERTAQFGPTYHYPHSQEISWTGPDAATGVVCAHAELAIGADTVWIALRYHDRYRREDQRWRFAERAVRFLYVQRLADLPTGMSEHLRVRWPGTDPLPAHLGG